MTCNKGHSLKATILSEIYHGDTPYGHGIYFCEICGQCNKGMAYHCMACKFSLCKGCYAGNTNGNKTCNRGHVLEKTTMHKLRKNRLNGAYTDIALCDWCRHIIWEDLYHCDYCDFDLCEKCYRTDPIQKNQASKSCPGNHGLKQFKTPKPGYGCDICKTRFQIYTTMYGCRICNYDVCNKCHGGSLQVSNQFLQGKNNGTKTCNRGHRLEKTTTRILRYRKQAYSGGAHCDWCKQNILSTIYHCGYCNFDLCPDCFEVDSTQKNQALVAKTCPGNHGLIRFRTSHGGYCCDICSKQIHLYSIAYGCNACNYDVCTSCFDGNNHGSLQRRAPLGKVHNLYHPDYGISDEPQNDHLAEMVRKQQAQIKSLQNVIHQKEAAIQSLNEELEEKSNDNLMKKTNSMWQWNDYGINFRSYDYAINAEIEKLSINESYYFFCAANQQNYKITKTSKNRGVQQNTKTGVVRNIHRQKIKKAELNGIEYPKWWNKYGFDNNADYGKPRLIELDLNKYQAKNVKNAFYKTVKDYEIIKIESVENQMLYDGYWSAKNKLSKLIGDQNLNERELYHGTGNEEVMKLVQKEGFRKEFNKTAMYGKGSYFAVSSAYSIGYSSKDNKGIYKMFQCKVICGQSKAGKKEYELTSWPKKKQSGLIYDSLVDNINNPSIYVIHDDARAYPMFVIHFRKRIEFNYYYGYH